MDLDTKKDLRLVDYLNKCRCCFEKLNYNENQMEITEIIEEQFLELTQIELKSSSSYSKSVCLKCTNELQSISNFRLDLITKQLQLYNFVTTSEYEIQDAVKFEPVYIKIETESTDELDNIFKLESQYQEIEKSELPVSEVDYKSPRKRFSLRQLKAIERKDEIKNRQDNRMHEKNPQLKTTVKKVSNSIKKICPQCGKMVLGSGTLSTHIRRVHMKEKNFFCDLCDFGAIIKSGIVDHMVVHLPKSMRKKLHCSKCEFVSIRASTMKSHVNRNCKEIKEKDERVCFCGKVFSNKYKLNYHITYTHQRKKNLICNVCKKTFTYKNQLKEHMKKHSGKIRKRELACEVCGKMFMTIDHLKSHLDRHKDPKYVCDFDGCTRKFFKTNRLESHKKTHIGQRDFACHLCDKKYYAGSALSNHIKNVHEQLRYICEVPGCSAQLCRKETYRNHVVSHHRNLPQDTIQNLLKRLIDKKPLCIKTK